MIFAILFEQLAPFLLLAGFVALFLGVAGAPYRRRLAEWQAKRKALEADLAREAFVSEELDRLVVLQGELAAHDVLRPERPGWMFWGR